MELQLKPVDKYDLRPIREIVFIELKKAIFDGRIKQGQHLVESGVAEKMDVSRTPVREALRQLESEGLVVNIPRKGAIVKGISLEDAMEIYDIREVLEGLAARLACRNISRDDVDRLKQILKSMEKAIGNKNYDNYLELHKGFNEIILNSSNNERLKNMMVSIYEHLISLRSISLYKEDRRFLALEEHREIVNAIESGDEDIAEELVKNHVIKAKEAFFDNLIVHND